MGFTSEGPWGFNPFAADSSKKVIKNNFPRNRANRPLASLCLSVVDVRFFCASNRSTIQNGQRRPLLRLYHCPHFPFPRKSPENPSRKKVSNYFLLSPRPG